MQILTLAKIQFKKIFWYFSGRIISVYRKQFYMNQEPLSVSHRAVKILKESVKEFVNDLEMEKNLPK